MESRIYLTIFVSIFALTNGALDLAVEDVAVEDAISPPRDFSKYEVKDDELLVTDRVYFDVTFGGHPSARIVIGLFGSVVPRTVANFLALANGKEVHVDSIGEDRYYGYKNSTFHRITPWFIQGGAFDNGNNVYGAALAEDTDWKDESYEILHYGAGYVSMANVGEYFGSQFCISLEANDYLDGKDVVFGKILEGMDTVHRIRKTPTGENDEPYETEIKIVDSGVIETNQPFVVSKNEVLPEDKDSLVTRLAYFDVTIGGRYIGRVTFGIFDQLTPITSENFAQLCTGVNGYGYKNVSFHRVIPNFMVQGGDFIHNNGYGFESVYGGNFNDENFVIENRGAGWLGMANAGPHTNGCQFYITTVWTPWLDNKHVIFGKVLSGMDVIRQIEWTKTDENDRPIHDVLVQGCNVMNLKEEEQFLVDKEPLSCQV